MLICFQLLIDQVGQWKTCSINMLYKHITSATYCNSCDSGAHCLPEEMKKSCNLDEKSSPSRHKMFKKYSMASSLSWYRMYHYLSVCGNNGTFLVIPFHAIMMGGGSIYWRKLSEWHIFSKMYWYNYYDKNIIKSRWTRAKVFLHIR